MTTATTPASTNLTPPTTPRTPRANSWTAEDDKLLLSAPTVQHVRQLNFPGRTKIAVDNRFYELSRERGTRPVKRRRPRQSSYIPPHDYTPPPPRESHPRWLRSRASLTAYLMGDPPPGRTPWASAP